MNDYFNITQYEAWPTLGEVFESGKIENSYHLFTADGLDWMIVSLEFAPRDAVLVWANQVVSQHSGYDCGVGGGSAWAQSPPPGEG